MDVFKVKLGMVAHVYNLNKQRLRQEFESRTFEPRLSNLVT